MIDRDTQAHSHDIPAEVDVAVVGGGPAGLAAAARLKELGVERVLVLEREPRLGGVPAWYTHMRTFGLLHFKRLLTGADYASRLIDAARRRGVSARTSIQVLSIDPDGSASEGKGGVVLSAVCPERGLVHIRARAVVLATGCREQPRSALRLPGSRPAGIYNTASALHFVDEMGQLPGNEAVVLGSEFVGFSAAAMMHGAGARVKCVVDDSPYRRGDLTGVVYFLLPRRIPLKVGYHVAEIIGEKRLEAVRLEPVAGASGRSGVTVPCDTLVISGNFTPNSELCAAAGVEVDAATRGPVIDNFYRTSVRGVFACGNVLRGAESADTALAEGRRAALAVKRYLEGTLPSGPTLLVDRSDELAYVLPQRLVPTTMPDVSFSVRPKALLRFPRIEALANGKSLGSARKIKATPIKTITVKANVTRLTKDTESIFVRLAD